MDDNSAYTPLLSAETADSACVHKSSLIVSLTKWMLLILMCGVFLLWVAFIFIYPGEFGNHLFEKWIHATSGTVFGITGSIFLAFSGPVIIIALLAATYVMISGENEFAKEKSYPRFRFWTFPALVDGPFGVVSASEFVGILLFVVFTIWAVYSYTVRNLSLLSLFQLLSKEKSILMLELSGLRFGMIGQLCLIFLFLPVARGSVLLRLIDIPFEHATRYHVWLGHLTMLLFTVHGLLYVIAWAMEGRLLAELLEWRNIGVANLPGVISLLAGLLMWVTSLHPVRKNYFELFFYTHQLYVVFVVFLALHVGDFIFSIAAGGIFLFVLDRFLRFCQSRKTVDVLSAKCLPCGTVELVLSKPANLRYNALSFIFLQVRELSWLQWHPFSVSSSPLDGEYHLSILLKVLGGWTSRLREKVLSMSDAEEQRQELPLQPQPKITASVEGPYGHEVPYHLMYEHLILVAGGIGISPFLAILSDILHRIEGGKACLPRKVMIVWAIKRSNEIPLLSTLDMESICPCFSVKLSVEIHIFITRESEPSLEEGRVHEAVMSPVCHRSRNGISVLVGTGNNVWSGLYIISSSFGFVVVVALLNILYVKPYEVTAWWYKGLLFVVCMIVSVMTFGGMVIGLWHVCNGSICARDDDKDHKKKSHNESEQSVARREEKEPIMKIQERTTFYNYGRRPDFMEIFGSVRKKWGHVDVGVIVCGPPTLQSSVAKEIRSHSIRRQRDDPIFHFNSHSFDL